MTNPLLLPAVPADDPLCLDAWANSCGIGPHVAIAVAASILAGVAGPLGRVPTKAAVLSPGICLAGRQSDLFLRMAVDGLIRPLLQIEKAVVAKSKEFTTEEIDTAMFAAHRQRTATDLAKLGEPSPLNQELADYSPVTRLEGDARISEQSIRYELLVRPGFMLAGHLPPSLNRILSGFHYGQGLLAGAAESLPREKSKRHHRLDELLKCFDGTKAVPSAANKGPIITPESVCMKGVLLFPSDQFDWLATSRRDFLSRVIPVAALPSGTGGDPADEIRAITFERLFQRTANHALALRRSHAPVMTPFHSEAAEVQFIARQRAFLHHLNEIPENQRVAAAGLPITLAWALLLLVGKTDLDSYILDTAFASARQIVEDARCLFVGFDYRTLGETRLKNARKLHARVIECGPLPCWQLLRGLDQQSLQVHGPVIQVMIQLGIIMRDDKDLLRPGTVPLHQMTAQHLIDLDPSA